MPGYIEEIENIPHAGASDKEVRELIEKLKVFKEDEFADLLHRCHNIIRNREHLDPAAAFDEIAKILFVKTGVEWNLKDGKQRENLFTAKFLEQQKIVLDDPMNVLFDQTKKNYKADRIFTDDDRINLKYNTSRAIVEELEKYNLSAVAALAAGAGLSQESFQAQHLGPRAAAKLHPLLPPSASGIMAVFLRLRDTPKLARVQW
jgi:type I restriction enzyme M protein